MRTIFLKSRNWIFPLLLFLVIVFTINLNLISKVDHLINRMDFDEFLNEKVKDFIYSMKENSDKALADSPDIAAELNCLNTVEPNLKRGHNENLSSAWETSRGIRE